MAEAYVFTKPLTVAIDIKNPQSYLAKDATIALANELNVEIDWLPIVVAPLRRAPEGGEDRGQRHRRLRAAYIEGDLARYAEVRGLTLKGIYRAPDSTLAGMGLLAAKAQSDSALRGYLDAVFDGYWNETIDIEDRDAIASLLTKHGVADFDTDTGESFAELQQRLSLAGLFNAPGYVVCGELFFGRAHLPMIRWILTGRTGTPPI